VFAQALLAHAKKQVLDLQQAAEFSEQTHTQQLLEYKHTMERAHKEHGTSLTSAEANIRRLSAQLDELTQELLTQRELATDRQTRSKHTLDSLHAQLHTLEQTNHTLTTNYTTQTNALSAQVHTLTSEHTHLQQQLAQERTAHTLCKQTHEHVSAQLSTLINEKATIEAQLFNANLENNELKHQLESLRTQHTTLRHTHEQVSDALVCAQSEKQAIEHQSMEHTFKLNATIDDLNAQLDECEQTLQQVRADRQAVIDTHTQRAAELEEKLEAQSEATHTLTMQLRAQEQSLASMTAHTQVVQSDCERTHTELDCAITSVSTYQQENAMLTRKLAQLQAEIAELTQERDSLSASNTQLAACVHTQESQLVECVDQWRACVQTDVGGDVSDTPTLFAHMLSAYKSVQANIHTLISERATLTAHTATLANRHTEELLLLQEEMNQYTRESEQTRDEHESYVQQLKQEHEEEINDVMIRAESKLLEEAVSETVIMGVCAYMCVRVDNVLNLSLCAQERMAGIFENQAQQFTVQKRELQHGIESMSQLVAHDKERIEFINTQFEELRKKIASAEQSLAAKDAVIDIQTQEIHTMQAQLKGIDLTFNKMVQESATELAKKDSVIKSQTQALEDIKGALMTLKTEYTDRFTQAHTQITARDTHIADLQAQLQQATQTYTQAHKQATAQTQQMQQLHSHNKILEDEKASLHGMLAYLREENNSLIADKQGLQESTKAFAIEMGELRAVNDELTTRLQVAEDGVSAAELRAAVEAKKRMEIEDKHNILQFEQQMSGNNAKQKSSSASSASGKGKATESRKQQTKDFDQMMAMIDSSDDDTGTALNQRGLDSGVRGDAAVGPAAGIGIKKTVRTAARANNDSDVMDSPRDDDNNVYNKPIAGSDAVLLKLNNNNNNNTHPSGVSGKDNNSRGHDRSQRGVDSAGDDRITIRAAAVALEQHQQQQPQPSSQQGQQSLLDGSLFRRIRGMSPQPSMSGKGSTGRDPDKQVIPVAAEAAPNKASSSSSQPSLMNVATLKEMLQNNKKNRLLNHNDGGGRERLMNVAANNGDNVRRQKLMKVAEDTSANNKDAGVIVSKAEAVDGLSMLPSRATAAGDGGGSPARAQNTRTPSADDNNANNNDATMRLSDLQEGNVPSSANNSSKEKEQLLKQWTDTTAKRIERAIQMKGWKVGGGTNSGSSSNSGSPV
jgi:hypothetical protein